MVYGGHGKKHQGQPGKDKRLDKANQQLKPVKRQSKHPWDKKCGYQQQYFPCRHITKETKGKADDAYQFTQRLQQTDKMCIKPVNNPPKGMPESKKAA